ncbi:stannin isoform X1 [Monodelphis domestica]|uniref:stannin isoform X1 n=1 Tax=Monodelphis domestica TaxID=13616 RepID=UPI0024E232CF|nr:stannin isoform X1 [Monodelphis domestica]
MSNSVLCPSFSACPLLLATPPLLLFFPRNSLLYCSSSPSPSELPSSPSLSPSFSLLSQLHLPPPAPTLQLWCSDPISPGAHVTGSPRIAIPAELLSRSVTGTGLPLADAPAPPRPSPLYKAALGGFTAAEQLSGLLCPSFLTPRPAPRPSRDGARLGLSHPGGGSTKVAASKQRHGRASAARPTLSVRKG